MDKMKYAGRHKIEIEIEIEMICLLEKILCEPWQSNLSKSELKYIDLLGTYREITGDNHVFCQKYLRLINIKEATEIERREENARKIKN